LQAVTTNGNGDDHAATSNYDADDASQPVEDHRVSF